jgi:hypothetical protein
MKRFRDILEEVQIHAMGVHVNSNGPSKGFTVAKVGKKVNPDHVKVGDTLSSSDLDDLADAGHKVREVDSSKKKLGEGTTGSGGYRTKDGRYIPFKSFEKAGQEIRAKRASAGRALADADKKTRANAKDEE